LKEEQDRLAADLAWIASDESGIRGAYKLTPEARVWGEKWYDHHNKHPPIHLQDDRFGGYIARKQTHLHKLAMVLAASCRDELIITAEDLALAAMKIDELEADMPKVFSKIGRSEDSVQAERFVQYVLKNSPISYQKAYAYMHVSFPYMKDFEDIVAGACRANLIKIIQLEGGLPGFTAP
jgi:hypothetical protein